MKKQISLVIFIIAALLVSGCTESSKSLQGYLKGVENHLKENFSYGSFDNVEKYLLAKNYIEANLEIQKIKKKPTGKKWQTIETYDTASSWLASLDEIEAFINRANLNKDNYEASGNSIIKLKNSTNYNTRYCRKSSIQGSLPSKVNFSSEFVDYINKRRREVMVSFVDLSTDLIGIAESKKEQARLVLEEQRAAAKLKRQKEDEERKRIAVAAKIEREKAAEEREQRKIAAKIEREKKEKAKQKAVKNEVFRLSELAKKSGYAGFSNMNVVAMIYKTQKEGGLENYLNSVTGCHNLNKSHCKNWYSKLKAIQILDDGVLFSFSEYSGGEYLDFTIYADKSPGKIYQEGQSFTNDLYVFDGMMSYTTVAGATKTIPHFRPANIR